MSKPTSTSPKPLLQTPMDVTDREREARRGTALRDNLRKRKQQQREREPVNTAISPAEKR